MEKSENAALQTSETVALGAEGGDGRAGEERGQRGRQRGETHAVEAQHAALLLLLDCGLHRAQGLENKRDREDGGRRFLRKKNTRTESVRHTASRLLHTPEKTAIGVLFQHSKVSAKMSRPPFSLFPFLSLVTS